MGRDANDRAKPPGIIEYLFAELRQAFQDIRQKVVEEGWFGRVVTAKPVHEVHHDILTEPSGHSSALDAARGQRPTFDELWNPCGQAEHDRMTAPEHEMDLER